MWTTFYARHKTRSAIRTVVATVWGGGVILTPLSCGIAQRLPVSGSLSPWQLHVPWLQKWKPHQLWGRFPCHNVSPSYWVEQSEYFWLTGVLGAEYMVIAVSSIRLISEAMCPT